MILKFFLVFLFLVSCLKSFDFGFEIEHSVVACFDGFFGVVGVAEHVGAGLAVVGEGVLLLFLTVVLETLSYLVLNVHISLSFHTMSIWLRYKY